MMKVKLLALAFLAAVPLQARPRAPRPGADALLLLALAPSTTAYSAVERVQVFGAGAKPKASTAHIAVLTGGRSRREVVAGRRKAAAMISLRDGREIFILWPGKKKMWRGPAFDESAQTQLARVRAFYELSLSTGGRVAKRATWRVDMRAAGGSLRRSLWLDRETGLRLKRETYRSDGSLARRERIIKLKLGAQAEPSAFEPQVPSGTEVAALSAPPFMPRWVPEGFILTEAGASSMTYSDGADSYVIERAAPGGRLSVKGGLSEDDAARVLDSIPGAK